MPQPVLHTHRLRLRPFGDADLPGFIDIYANPVTAHFLGGLCNDEDAWRRMATMVGHVALRGYGPWALEEQATGVFIGYCGPWNPHGWPEREIAWTLRSAFHGRGYATEAARAALAFAYEILNWDTAVSCMALDNADSIRVAERLGAVRECTTHNRGFQIGIYRHVSPAQLRQGALAGT
jgi:RimJ/RimL family protein N-acetyltransferase